MARFLNAVRSRIKLASILKRGLPAGVYGMEGNGGGGNGGFLPVSMRWKVMVVGVMGAPCRCLQDGG